MRSRRNSCPGLCQYLWLDSMEILEEALSKSLWWFTRKLWGHLVEISGRILSKSLKGVCFGEWARILEEILQISDRYSAKTPEKIWFIPKVEFCWSLKRDYVGWNENAFYQNFTKIQSKYFKRFPKNQKKKKTAWKSLKKICSNFWKDSIEIPVQMISIHENCWFGSSNRSILLQEISRNPWWE